MALASGDACALDDGSARAARLSYVQGGVSVQRADNTGSDPGQLNQPLTEGQRVATGDDGRAEIEFEDGSLLRLPPQSTVALSQLGLGQDGGARTRITLASGLVYAELRATTKSAYALFAGEDAISPIANASVRVTLDQPPAEIAVLDGAVHVVRASSGDDAGFATDVRAGESLRADASGGGRYFLSQRVEHNSWDDWNEEREQAAANDLAARTTARDGYAGEQGYGWSDLDANGTWYDTGQGTVWQPFDANASGFDPYGYGSWVYASGPGYVWSSGYAWGWTPFRCGSWNYWNGFGWGWRPGGNCGYAGWGYGGGPGHPVRVNRINLSNVPPGYKRPLPPTPGGPVRVHPIVPVRTGPPAITQRGQAYQAREIAGQMALPLRVAGSTYTPRGGSAVGSSLRRDFPMDTATRQPVLGNVRVPTDRRGMDAVSSGATAGVQGSERHRNDVPRAGYAGRNGTGSGAVGLGGVRVNPGYRVNGGVPVPSVPGTLNGVPAPVNSVPAPLHGEPAPLNTVPRLPVIDRTADRPADRSVPVLPPMQQPRSAPSVQAPVRVVPSVPMAPRSAPVAPPPAPAPVAAPKR